MAQFALLFWPLIGLAIFAFVGPIRGLIWTTMIGYLFLPETFEFDIPALPPYHKGTAVAVTALVGVLLTYQRIPETLRRPGPSIFEVFKPTKAEVTQDHAPRPVLRRFGTSDDVKNNPSATNSHAVSYSTDTSATGSEMYRVDRTPKSGLVESGGDPVLRLLLLACVTGLLLFPIATVHTNPEALRISFSYRPALSFRDAISMALETLVLITPFLLARRFLYNPVHIRELLIAVVVMGLFYSMLVLFERRFSPQLHIWVYGYFQHSWIQHIRGGDYRPAVFLQHGLWVGFFLFSVTVSAFALSREAKMPTLVMLAAGFWMLAVLIASKNLGALVLAAVFVPLLLFTGRRVQTLGAATIGLFFLLYPHINERTTAPSDFVIELAEMVSAQRAQSFAFRVNNELMLLERAMEKPWFGWGGWSRARIVNEHGFDITVADGTWIIIFGQGGWAGYICFFGLLIFPTFFLFRTARRKTIPPSVMALALISAANLIYLIPNSTLSPIGLLMFGALAAFAERDFKEVQNLDYPHGKMSYPYSRYSNTRRGKDHSASLQR